MERMSRRFALVVQAFGTVGTAVRPGFAPLALGSAGAEAASGSANATAVEKVEAMGRGTASVAVLARARA